VRERTIPGVGKFVSDSATFNTELVLCLLIDSGCYDVGGGRGDSLGLIMAQCRIQATARDVLTVG